MGIFKIQVETIHVLLCEIKTRELQSLGTVLLGFPCLFDAQGVTSRSAHSIPPVLGSSCPITGSARSQLCWGRARAHFPGEGCAVEVLSPSNVGHPVPFLHAEDESLVTCVVGWRWLGINFSPLTLIPAGSILYSLVARNTVACAAVKSHITFIDLKKREVCAKSFSVFKRSNKRYHPSERTPPLSQHLWSHRERLRYSEASGGSAAPATAPRRCNSQRHKGNLTQLLPGSQYKFAPSSMLPNLTSNIKLSCCQQESGLDIK